MSPENRSEKRESRSGSSSPEPVLPVRALSQPPALPPTSAAAVEPLRTTEELEDETSNRTKLRRRRRG